MENGHYYFAFLTEEEQKQYKENFDKYSTNLFGWEDWNSEQFENFESYILRAFPWSSSKQKHTYWANISDRDNNTTAKTE